LGASRAEASKLRLRGLDAHWSPSFRALKLRAFKASRLQGFKASRLQGFKASRLQGFKASVRT
jgi:hypothetical protein